MSNVSGEDRMRHKMKPAGLASLSLALADDEGIFAPCSLTSLGWTGRKKSGRAFFRTDPPGI